MAENTQDERLPPPVWAVLAVMVLTGASVYFIVGVFWGIGWAGSMLIDYVIAPLWNAFLLAIEAMVGAVEAVIEWLTKIIVRAAREA